jgi:NADPH:quinone reductase-like Zn-dependent oxidoreductase
MQPLYYLLYSGQFIPAARPQGVLACSLKELFEADKVKPVIDRCYPLSHVPEAFRYLEEGLAKGKIVITLENNIKT